MQVREGILGVFTIGGAHVGKACLVEMSELFFVYTSELHFCAIKNNHTVVLKKEKKNTCWNWIALD